MFYSVVWHGLIVAEILFDFGFWLLKVLLGKTLTNSVGEAKLEVAAGEWASGRASRVRYTSPYTVYLGNAPVLSVIRPRGSGSWLLRHFPPTYTNKGLRSMDGSEDKTEPWRALSLQECGMTHWWSLILPTVRLAWLDNIAARQGRTLRESWSVTFLHQVHTLD